MDRATVAGAERFVFTVFTPTLDRAHTLERVYRSLVAQTFRDFEWIVVDDGSTDGTEQLVGGWRAEAPFPIIYQFQEHRGKHVATNRAVAVARGDLFLTLDSDDSCIPRALERFKSHWDAIPAGRASSLLGGDRPRRGRTRKSRWDALPARPDRLEPARDVVPVQGPR